MTEFKPGLYIFMSYMIDQNEPSRPHKASTFTNFAELEVAMKADFAEMLGLDLRLEAESEEMSEHEVIKNQNSCFADYQIGEDPVLLVSKVQF